MNPKLSVMVHSDWRLQTSSCCIYIVKLIFSYLPHLNVKFPIFAPLMMHRKFAQKLVSVPHLFTDVLDDLDTIDL